MFREGEISLTLTSSHPPFHLVEVSQSPRNTTAATTTIDIHQCRRILTVLVCLGSGQSWPGISTPSYLEAKIKLAKDDILGQLDFVDPPPPPNKESKKVFSLFQTTSNLAANSKRHPRFTSQPNPLPTSNSISRIPGIFASLNETSRNLEDNDTPSTPKAMAKSQYQKIKQSVSRLMLGADQNNAGMKPSRFISTFPEAQSRQPPPTPNNGPSPLDQSTTATSTIKNVRPLPRRLLASTWANDRRGVLVLCWTDLMQLTCLFKYLNLTDNQGFPEPHVFQQQQHMLQTFGTNISPFIHIQSSDKEKYNSQLDSFPFFHGGSVSKCPPFQYRQPRIAPADDLDNLAVLYDKCWHILTILFTGTMAIRLVGDDQAAFGREIDPLPLLPQDPLFPTPLKTAYYGAKSVMCCPDENGNIGENSPDSATKLQNQQRQLLQRHAVLTWFPKLKYLEIQAIPTTALIGWSFVPYLELSVLFINNPPQFDLRYMFARQEEGLAERLPISPSRPHTSVQFGAQNHLPVWDCLEFLDLSGQCLPHFNAITRQAVSLLPFLRRLSLAGCGMSAIPDTLWRLHLEWLDMSCNALRDCRGLDNRMSNLTHLDLSDNEISQLHPLTRLTSLLWLDVSDNTIQSWKGVAVLRQLNNLNYLWIHNNPFVLYSNCDYEANIYRAFWNPERECFYLDGKLPSTQVFTRIHASLPPPDPSPIAPHFPMGNFENIMSSTEADSEYTESIAYTVTSPATSKRTSAALSPAIMDNNHRHSHQRQSQQEELRLTPSPCETIFTISLGERLSTGAEYEGPRIVRHSSDYIRQKRCQPRRPSTPIPRSSLAPIKRPSTRKAATTTSEHFQDNTKVTYISQRQPNRVVVRRPQTTIDSDYTSGSSLGPKVVIAPPEIPLPHLLSQDTGPRANSRQSDSSSLYHMKLYLKQMDLEEQEALEALKNQNSHIPTSASSIPAYVQSTISPRIYSRENNSSEIKPRLRNWLRD